MKAKHHLIISLVLALLLYYFTQSLFSFLTIVSGFIIDIDHLLDFWLYKHKITMTKEIFNGFHLRWDKAYVFLHSIELLLLFLILSIIKPLWWLPISVGYTAHMVMDIVANGAPLRAYFLTYRIAKHFNRTERGYRFPDE